MKTRRLAAGALSIALAVTMLSTTAFAASVKFTDVPSSHWAHASISEMADKGVVSGTGNNKYSPNTTVSYAQFATMIVRSFYNDQIGDAGEKWYSPYMTAAEKAGVLDGTKVLGTDSLAEDGICRYEMAQVMYNVMKAKGIQIPSNVDTSKIADWSKIPQEYQQAVSVCYSLGTLSGTDNKGTFNGTGVMDRAQAAVVMDRLLEVCSGGTPSVPTVPVKPAGSKQITSIPQLLTKDGMEEYPGGFHANPDLVSYGCSGMGIASKGFSKFSFTFKAADTDTCIEYLVKDAAAGYIDPAVLKETVVVKAGETKTFTFDCSNSQGVGLEIKKNGTIGVFSEGWITNIFFN